MEKYDSVYTQCPICQSSRIALYHQDCRDNKIFRCDDCRVQFMNPVYSDEYLNQYYAEYYTGSDSTGEVTAGHERTNLIKFRAIEKYCKQPGHVLDFGCGNGNFIKTAQDKGWQVTGYDVDCDAMQHVARRYHVEVGCGKLHDIDWPREQFDLIHAHHVVEHLKTPVADLKKLNRWLKTGGYFYVGVPNIHATSARIKFFLEKIGLRRKNVGKYYDTDHHVFYYTPASLSNLMRQSGFEILMVMNGNKSHVSDSRIIQFFTYDLMNYIYSNSGFFIIARKLQDVD